MEMAGGKARKSILKTPFGAGASRVFDAVYAAYPSGKPIKGLVSVSGKFTLEGSTPHFQISYRLAPLGGEVTKEQADKFVRYCRTKGISVQNVLSKDRRLGPIATQSHPVALLSQSDLPAGHAALLRGLGEFRKAGANNERIMALVTESHGDQLAWHLVERAWKKLEGH